MKKLLSVCFLLLMLCGCNATPVYEPPKAEVSLNGEMVELTPDVDILNGNEGGIWDSPANELPMLFVSNADTISLAFPDEAPLLVKTKKYDVFDMEDVIGNPNARSGPTDLEATCQEAVVSFEVVQEESTEQLITVIGEWGAQEILYAFVVSFA